MRSQTIPDAIEYVGRKLLINIKFQQRRVEPSPARTIIAKNNLAQQLRLVQYSVNSHICTKRNANQMEITQL